MKIKLNRGFTDIEIDGQLLPSPFMSGDEVEVIKVVQRCPDRGCCELAYTVATPAWNDGREFVGYKFYDSTEGIDDWDKEWDKDNMIMTYYPPE